MDLIISVNMNGIKNSESVYKVKFKNSVFSKKQKNKRRREEEKRDKKPRENPSGCYSKASEFTQSETTNFSYNCFKNFNELFKSFKFERSSGKRNIHRIGSFSIMVGLSLYDHG
ncbi:hypothetical protein CEXT_191491 [Caerostris extrusa]|uniref:Ycf1 n=1 Tax=Caerostris extrusa TaxID=172846 RepID=A0AAV4N5C9_CAEEX|nr:hypothetical protein CEXT_191491 [Caerostris extrusa]